MTVALAVLCSQHLLHVVATHPVEKKSGGLALVVGLIHCTIGIVEQARLTSNPTNLY